MRPDLRALLVALSLLTLACAPPTSLDAGGDAGDEADAGSGDAGADDDDDAGPGLGDDAGASHGTDGGPAPGFGALSGACGVLDDELLAAEPFLFVNAIDFGSDPYDDGDYALLTPGGQEILDDGNAGGSSLHSEVFAYEALARCEGAELLKTETEIEYVDPQGKITDLLVHIDGARYGVSVTRAVAFPFDAPYSVEQAQALLEQKLEGVLLSSANVAESDAWQKQILSVIAYGPGHAEALASAFELVDASLKADTIVYVTVSNGVDAFLY